MIFLDKNEGCKCIGNILATQRFCGTLDEIKCGKNSVKCTWEC